MSVSPVHRDLPEDVNIALELTVKNIQKGFGARLALVWEEGELSYAALAGRVEALGRGLALLELDRGAPVLLRLPNCVEFVLSFLALMRDGLLPTVHSTLLDGDDLARVVARSGAGAAITIARLAPPLMALRERLGHGLVVARGTRAGQIRFEQLAAGEDAAVATVARPIEHAFLACAVAEGGAPELRTYPVHEALGGGVAHRSDDVVLTVGEWSQPSLLINGLLGALRDGATVAVLEGRPSPERVLEAVERYGVNVLHAPGWFLSRLLALDGIEKAYELGSLRLCVAASERVEEAAVREIALRFGCDVAST